MGDISGIQDITMVIDILGYTENILSIAFIHAWLIIWDLRKTSEKTKRKERTGLIIDINILRRVKYICTKYIFLVNQAL